VSWKAHKGFYIFVFVVTGVLVYQWGWLKADRQQPAGEYTATATVRHDDVGRPFQADVRQEILSAASLDRAVRELDSRIVAREGETREAAIQRAVEEARSNLRVEVTGTLGVGETQVAITTTQAQPDYALLLANTLAEHYAADCRTHWKAAAQDAYLAARTASQQAQRDLFQAKARLETFEKELQQQAAKPPAPKPVPVAEAKPVEDPQWTELNGQLTHLRQRRTALLIDRTPAHPAVEEVELRIAETRQLLDATPRWIADPQSPTPANKQPVVVEGKPEPAVPPAETARQLQNLRDAVAWAGSAGDTAAAAERRAWRAFEQEPRIDVQLAQNCEETVGESGGPGAGLLFASLFVGLAATAGMCLLGAGICIEPTVSSIAELESLLGAPVVGTVPTQALGAESAETAQRQRLTRWALIGGGAMALVFCVLLARWVLGG
jgi:hypothetical protein